MSRFAEKGSVNNPDAVASLALLRAIVGRLQTLGLMPPEAIEAIRKEALAQIGHAANEGLNEARRLVKEEFP